MSAHIRDLNNNAIMGGSPYPAAVTDTAGGAAVDMLNAKDSVFDAILSVGAVTGTNPTLAVKVQESDDTVDGNFTDITGATFTGLTASSASSMQTITGRRTKRYLRLYRTIGGTSTPTFNISGIILSQRQQVPSSVHGS